MNDLMHYLEVATCLLVMTGCICRLDILNPRRNRLSPIAMYLTMAAFAGGVLADLLSGWHIDWYDALALIAILLHMWGSREQWAHGPPPDTCRASLEPDSGPFSDWPLDIDHRFEDEHHARR